VVTFILSCRESKALRLLTILSEKNHASITAKERTVALDSRGRAIRDSQGNPVYNLVEQPGAAPAGDSSKTRIDAKIFEFEMSNGDAAKKP